MTTMTNRRNILAGMLGTVCLAAGASSAKAADDCTEKTKLSALLDRYVAALNAHDARSYPDMFAETYIQHSGRSPSGLAAQIENLGHIVATWPDIQLRVEDRIFDGNKIAARSLYTATHTQTVQGFAPTGNRISFTTLDIWRVENGKFAEHWDLVDTAGLQKQLRGE
jgi:predicted ester cyclase